MKSLRLVIAASAICLASAAAGQPASQARPSQATPPIPRTAFIATMETEFRKIDADKNGIVTRKEVEDFQRAVSVFVAQRRNVALFQALDKDKNGQLTPAEFAALPMNMPKADPNAVFAQTDGNRDGQITLIEYRAGKLVNFDRMDADKDGIVTPAEMKAAGLIK